MASLLCVGDSHSRLIGLKPPGATFRYGRVCPTIVEGFDQSHIFSLRGATAMGFRPKADPECSYSRVSRCIERLNPDTICFGFGQVDAELSCYYQALRDGSRIEDAIRTRKRAMQRYLRHCQRIAGGRRILIKGLNTVALRNTGSLRMMILRNLVPALGIAERDLADWLDVNDVTLSLHARINNEIATALRRAVERVDLAYFDLRSTTGIKRRIYLSKREFCGRSRDVHLRALPGIEARFARGLSDAVIPVSAV